MTPRTVRTTPFTALLASAMLIAFTATAHAAALLVDTLQDDIPSDGLCSLREAIEAANTDADAGDCIGSGVYGDDEIQFSVAGTINVLGELDVTDNLSIDGAGQIVLNGGNLNRIFDAEGAMLELRLTGLTLRNGFDEMSTGGGCIRVFGAETRLEIEDSTLTSCRVVNSGPSPSLGGAIAMGRSTPIEPRTTVGPDARGAGPPSQLVLRRVAFLDNRADTGPANAAGGAIHAGPDPMDILIEDSRFHNNVAQSLGGGDAFGGALRVQQALQLIVQRTEWTVNSALGVTGSGFGGALYIDELSGPGLVQNSTFSANDTLAAGLAREARAGAIYAQMTAPDGLFALNNATVFDNRSLAGAEALAFSGGIELDGGDARIANTILAGNLVDRFADDPGNPQAADCLFTAAFVSLGHNLYGASCGLPPAIGDQVDASPMLQGLEQNGGAIDGMLSHRPMANSPATDAGNPAPVQPVQPIGLFQACSDIDQRGVTRPIDAGGGPVCDIGAIETSRVLPEALAIPAIGMPFATLLAVLFGAIGLLRLQSNR